MDKFVVKRAKLSANGIFLSSLIPWRKFA